MSKCVPGTQNAYMLAGLQQCSQLKALSSTDITVIIYILMNIHAFSYIAKQMVNDSIHLFDTHRVTNIGHSQTQKQITLWVSSKRDVTVQFNSLLSSILTAVWSYNGRQIIIKIKKNQDSWSLLWASSSMYIQTSPLVSTAFWNILRKHTRGRARLGTQGTGYRGFQFI